MSIKLGIPKFGIYSGLLKFLLQDLGIEAVMPARVTSEIIKLGAANSSDMVCFPYKVTLGQQIWCLENGATDLLMWDNAGLCRQKHYYQLQELTLARLGYNFTMHPISVKNGLAKVAELLGVSSPAIASKAMDIWRDLLVLEDRAFPRKKSPLKIGLVGEIYTILEPDINFDIIKKLQQMGVDVDISVKLSDFIRHNWLGQEERKEEQDEAKSLLSSEIGGHGFDSIYNTIHYGKAGYDGVIHLLPLSCMPESTVEPIVDYVAEKYKIPLYRFPVDEATFEVGFNTRLETFVSMLKRRKKCGPA